MNSTPRQKDVISDEGFLDCIEIARLFKACDSTVGRTQKQKRQNNVVNYKVDWALEGTVMALTMDMDAKKAELLLRSALLDDASNINERFAALLADISVDDDGEAWITLDMDLWPEEKISSQAEAVAKMFWLEIEWTSTAGTFPFAWPGLGEHANQTTEYFKMVLDAYGGQKPDQKE